jgi:hypothetical protein
MLTLISNGNPNPNPKYLIQNPNPYVTGFRSLFKVGGMRMHKARAKT